MGKEDSRCWMQRSDFYKRKVKDWTTRTTVKALLDAEEWGEDLRTRFIGMERRDLIGNTRTAESTTLAIDESKKTIEIRNPDLEHDFGIA